MFPEQKAQQSHVYFMWYPTGNLTFLISPKPLQGFQRDLTGSKYPRSPGKSPHFHWIAPWMNVKISDGYVF